MTGGWRQASAALGFGLLAGWLGWVVLRSALLLPHVGAQGTLVDFDAFYIVGELVREGRAAAAYDPQVMAAIQTALIGAPAFMPWTYPPPFDLLVALLPSLPRGAAHLAFTGATLAAWIWVLARLAGPHRLAVLLALAPPAYVGAAIGQNGFLTGALAGAACLLMLAGRAGAGWVLGLFVIKPHLAVGLGVLALAQGRWGVVARAAAAGLALLALSTLALGWAIWPAFAAAVAEAGAALRTGFYPLYRMPSVHAALAGWGVPVDWALRGQLAAAVLACAAVAWAARRAPLNQALAVACFASVLVSPYAYDYDLTVPGIGLALIARDLLARSGAVERAALLALAWVAGGWGLVQAAGLAGQDWEARIAAIRALPALAAPAYLLALALVWRILRRPL